MLFRAFVICILAVILEGENTGCRSQDSDFQFINPRNSKIYYQGRVDSSKANEVGLFWSGTSFTIQTNSTTLGLLFDEEFGNNYYNILVNNVLDTVIQPSTKESEYIVLKDLGSDFKEIKVFKRTEFRAGESWLKSITIDKSASITSPNKRTRSIEFYGNSITAGYAVEDSIADRSFGLFTNNYKSYSRICSDYFNAHYQCIAKSGIGLKRSWSYHTMPEIMNRCNPNDSINTWNFNDLTPGVVVVNLLQNDYMLSGKKLGNWYRYDNFKQIHDTDILNSYQTLIGRIRTLYPKTYIVCMIGSMSITSERSVWPKALSDLVNKMEDDRISFFYVTCKQMQAHPKVNEHKEIAKALIAHIEENVQW